MDRYTMKKAYFYYERAKWGQLLPGMRAGTTSQPPSTKQK
jgi:hypothetical protein